MKNYVALLAVILFSNISYAQLNSEVPSEYSEKTNASSEIVYMINEAHKLMGQKGEAAFKEFKAENSVWNDGKFDLYVIDEDSGEFIIYPSSEKIDPSHLDIKNLNGKIFIKQVLNDSKESGKLKKFMGMVLNPEYDTNPANYAKKITIANGKKYVITASASNLDFQKTVLKGVVNEASALIADKGQAAFEELRKPNSIFRFKDTYVFVMDKNGKVLVNPAKPDWENKNIFELEPNSPQKDENTEMFEKALTGEAWVMGRSVSPLKNMSQNEYKKLYFVKKVSFKNETYIVGSGIYFYDNNNRSDLKK